MRIYRQLCKQTHPDLSGLSADAFVAVQEAFAEALVRVRNRSAGERDLDPYAVIRDSGYPDTIPERPCFLIALMRYTNLGLYSYRIRRNPHLQRRSAQIVASVEHWARVYDPPLVPLFRAFDETQLRPLASTAEMQRYHRARRVLLDGLHTFFQFQRLGRQTTGQIAAERLRYAVTLLETLAPQERTLGLARRLVVELGYPPVSSYLPAAGEVGARPAWYRRQPHG